MRLRALSNPRLEAMTFIVSRLSVGSVLATHRATSQRQRGALLGLPYWEARSSESDSLGSSRKSLIRVRSGYAASAIEWTQDGETNASGCR
jgi:hypothetical protein